MVENPDLNVVSFSEAVQVREQPDSLEEDRPSSPEPEPEHQSSTEAKSASTNPTQQTPEPRGGSTSLLLIELRKWQLHNRRMILLQPARGVEENKEEGAGEDGDPASELEAIQKELEELAVKEEVLQKQLGLYQDQKHTRCPSEEVHHVISYDEPPQVPEEEVTSSEPETAPEAKKTLPSPIPVDHLTSTPAAVQCPSCGEVIITETHRRVGRTMWMLCCLSSVIGCVAGCCLIPFVIDRLKDVYHQCPLCQSHIHSYQHL